jgi:hypothetical protein
MLWVYDIETYVNFFSVTFKEYKTGEVKQFVVFENRNDLKDLITFCKSKWLVGYNSFSFDNQILYFLKDKEDVLDLLDTYTITKSIHDFALGIIDGTIKRLFIPNYFYWIDLMKAGNLNNKSLKMVGTLMKWYKLQDLPYAFDSEITNEQVDTILKYNLNDVEITEKLLRLLEPQIKLRFDISKLYNIRAHSESDSGIANRLLEKFYSEGTGLEVKDFKQLRTKRPIIRFRDVVYLRNIKFKTPELSKLLEDVLNYTYYESKPFFNKSIIIDGLKYKLGIGGIHSDDQPEKFDSTDDVDIIDCDIASMYPSIIINNYIYPEHLNSIFLKQYNDIRLDRVKAKKEGNRTIADTLKIVLNSVYGKLKYEHHWLYDPLCALRVTINGQLYVLMLIEKLTMMGFKVISANTDGVITIVPKNKKELYHKVCKEWEEETSFELEYTVYKRYARRDVNNYVAIKEDGKVKTKGDFIYPKATEPEHLLEDPWVLRRGFDKPIIALALNEYFINDTPVEETIRNHKDIYDFCTSQKTDSKFQNEFHYLKDQELFVEKLQQSVRYFVSTDGGSLYKRHKAEDRVINYALGKRVTVFNDYFEKENFDDYNIDYSYYIFEAQKIVELIDNPQLKLF